MITQCHLAMVFPIILLFHEPPGTTTVCRHDARLTRQRDSEIDV